VTQVGIESSRWQGAPLVSEFIFCSLNSISYGQITPLSCTVIYATTG